MYPAGLKKNSFCDRVTETVSEGFLVSAAVSPMSDDADNVLYVRYHCGNANYRGMRFILELN